MPEEDNIQSHTSDDHGINEYIKSPCASMEINPLKFWKDNEKEWQSDEHFGNGNASSTASSAPVERLFSVAGKVFRPERCRLTDNTFKILMFIRCNKF